MKLLIWDGCVTVTQTPLGRMTFIYPASYRYETIMWLKACNWNVTRKLTQVYSEKPTLKLVSGFSIKAQLSFSVDISW